MSKRDNQRGDTIIEVLFAVTVFSLVAVGGLSLMNQGTAMAQRALEIGLVRQQMDTQADALRYLSRAYVESFQAENSVAADVWEKVVVGNRQDKALDFDMVSNGVDCRLPEGGNYHPFALDVTKLNDSLDTEKHESTISSLVLMPSVKNTATYAKIETEPQPEAQGIWVEAVQQASSKDFYDFHITGCWQSPGQAAPIKLGTIVRLYAPEK